MARTRKLLTPDAASALQATELTEKDGPTRGRIQAVRLYGLGLAVPHIQTITGMSRTRLLECYRAYQEGGLTALADGRTGGNNRKLTLDHWAELKAKLHQYTPKSLFGPEAATPTGQFWTLPDLKRAVQQWFGVTYQSDTTYYTLLARCGFSYQRPDQVFKSRKAAAVHDWEERAEKN
jgi:transposase